MILVDLQRPTEPLWKDLELIGNIDSAKETSSVLKIGFALSKWPHLHRAYLVIGRYLSLETVYLISNLVGKAKIIFFSFNKFS